MRPNLLPVSTCPTCGYKMDCASCYYDEKARPRPGDYSVCMKCGEIQRFTEALTLRAAELNDFIGLDKETNEHLTKVQTLVRRERVLG